MLNAHLTKQIAASMWRYKVSNSTPSLLNTDAFEEKRLAFASQCYRYLSACSISVHDSVLGFYAANRALAIAEKLGNTAPAALRHHVNSLTLHALYMSKVSVNYAEDAFARAEKMADDLHDPRAYPS
jgi:hypothetical protein